MSRILPRHWLALAQKSGVPDLAQSMVLLAKGVETALEVAKEMLPEGFPDLLWHSIATGTSRQAKTFLAA
jgi:hypothetical protein